MPDTLFSFILKTSLGQQILVSFLSVGVFLLTLVPLELQRRIVNDVVENQNIDLLILFSGLYLAGVLTHGGLKYFMNVVRGRISETAIRILRGHIIETSGNTGDRNATEKNGDEGTVVSAVSAEVEPLGGFIGESISGPLLQGGILVSVLGYMFWVNPVLAVVGLGLFLPQLFFVPPIQMIINNRAKERIETLRDLSDIIVEEPEDGQATQTKETNGYKSLIDQIYKLRMKIFHWKYLMKFLINLLEQLATIGIVSIGGWLVIQGETEIGTIIAFVSGIQRIGQPWRALISHFRQVTDARIKYDLIRKIETGEFAA